VPASLSISASITGGPAADALFHAASREAILGRMFDPQMALLSKHLESLLPKLDASEASRTIWRDMRDVVSSTRDKEPDLAAAIDAEDADRVRAIVAEWSSGKRLLPEQDREVLKRALKAFRKSLKVTRLDAESSIAGGPMSSGRQSHILGMTPPSRYPREVWDELVRQGRLLGGKQGIYELPPE